jgi:stage IV sporulation protein B
MKRKFLLIFTLIMLCVLSMTVVPMQMLSSLEDNFIADYEDVEVANKNYTFGHFIRAELESKNKSVSEAFEGSGTVTFKLFGILPIKKVSVKLASDDEFYVGGTPIGIEINTDGAIVVSGQNDEICGNLREGDIITEVDGVEIDSLDSLSDTIQSGKDEVEVKFLRKNKEIKTLIKTERDEKSGRLKLGLMVKDEVAGIGTLTFVNTKTHEYGALGHPIVESKSENIVPVSSGEVYKCSLIGINKGKKNAPGELRCVFSSNGKNSGTIEKNDKFGISGVLDNVNGLVDENLTAKLGGRLGVTMGKAKIVSSVSGILEEYDIEIIKANYQKSANDKSLVFRVKDKRLLSLTGGIVQGMSGSPIIQNGKIIGAVTHVFMSDPTKGYGVYVDWML